MKTIEVEKNGKTITVTYDEKTISDLAYFHKKDFDSELQDLINKVTENKSIVLKK